MTGRPVRLFAAVATAVLALLHVRTFLLSGALWRDEADTLALATLPTLGELWDRLLHSSSLILWPLVVRAWSASGLGASDLGLRALGLLVGLGVVAVLWRNAASFGAGAPVLSLALVGFNAAVISFGDSLRAYGLGMLAGTLAFGLLWNVVREPRPWRVLAALLASVAAAQCLFHDLTLLGAAVLGGIVVCVRRGRPRRAALVAGIGLTAAASVLPYAGLVERAREWDAIVRVPVSAPRLAGKLWGALALSGVSTPWLWLVLVAVALGLAILTQRGADGPEPTSRDADLAAYCGVTLVAAVVAYGALLLLVSYPTQPWYYLPLLAVAGSCVEGCLSAAGHAGARARVAFSALVIVVTLPAAWRIAGLRRTNVDVVAAEVARRATPGDLVVVSPWWTGVSFSRYYRGTAPWVTVPPVSSLVVHRYDLLMEQMSNPRAMEPVVARLRGTLENGGRVFWVGPAPELERGGRAADGDPTSPAETGGAAQEQWQRRWTREAERSLAVQSARVEPVPMPLAQSVNPYERLELSVVTRRPGSGS